MRLCALVTDAFGGKGGIAQSNRDLLEAIVRIDPKNTITVLPRFSVEGAWLPDRVTQKIARKNRLEYARCALMALIKDRKFDAIFCGHIYMAPLAFLISKMTRIPFWLHIHGFEAWQAQSVWIRNSAENARLVTVISRFTRNRFLSWANIDAQKVRVLPNTFGEKYTPGGKPAHLLKKYGLEGKNILLTVGRISTLDRYKGHDRVIEILKGLIDLYPNIAYVIAGDGDDQKRLFQLSVERGVSDKIHFIGQVSDDELPDVYRMADVFVMPSTGEGFGIVFIEAMACGIPVVAGNKDGSVDCLEGNRLGHLTDPYNKKELLETVIQALGNRKTDRQDVLKFSRGHYEEQIQSILHLYFGN